MYEQGLSVEDVANYYGVSRQSMWVWLKRRGVKMRPKIRFGESNRFYRGGKTHSKRAQHVVEMALKKGIISRPDRCQECGGMTEFKNGRHGLEGHHDDYNKPLKVRWLCRVCHHKWHEQNRAVRVKADSTSNS